MLRNLDDYRDILKALQLLPEAERMALCRQLCRQDLFFLMWYGLGRKDMFHPWIMDRCREVDTSPDGYLDLWSREHYKSTIITFGKTIQDILSSHGQAPDPKWGGREVTFGMFSHTRPNSKRFLRQIKMEFEGNALLKGLFPDILYSAPEKESPKWSEDDGIIVKRSSNPTESTVEAWGLVDGQPTGKHFFILVYDDVVTDKSVTTPEMMEKTTDALALSYNLGCDGGKRRWIGTRYHFNDTYRVTMERGTVTPRIYPATDDGTFDGNPVLWTREKLQEKRRDMGPYVASSQLLQNPVADEAQGFRRDWLKYWNPRHSKSLNYYILVDPASEKKKTSDYTSMWVVGLSADRKVRVAEMWRDRWNLSERVKKVFSLHKKYRPIEVRYEKYGMMADIERLREKMEEELYHFEVIEVGGQTGKNDRIRRLIPYFEQGRILLPEAFLITDYQGKQRDMVHAFVEEEYAGFPVPVHDDMLDSLARIAEPDLPLLWPHAAFDDNDKERRGRYTMAKSHGGRSWMSR